MTSATAPSSPKVLAEVAGTYQLVTGGPTLIEAAITVEGGKLRTSCWPIRTRPSSLRTSGIPMVFERDAKKKVTGVTIDGAIKGKKVK